MMTIMMIVKMTIMMMIYIYDIYICPNFNNTINGSEWIHFRPVDVIPNFLFYHPVVTMNIMILTMFFIGIHFKFSTVTMMVMETCETTIIPKVCALARSRLSLS